MTVSLENGPTSKAKIMHVEGEIDLYASKEFQTGIENQFASGVENLLLDFHKVEYLDSSGVGCIIRMLQKAKTLKARMAFRGLRGTALKVLELSHVLTLLTLCEDQSSVDTFLGGS